MKTIRMTEQIPLEVLYETTNINTLEEQLMERFNREYKQQLITALKEALQTDVIKEEHIEGYKAPYYSNSNEIYTIYYCGHRALKEEREIKHIFDPYYYKVEHIIKYTKL